MTALKEKLATDAKLEAIRSYWNKHIHDLEIATQPVGSQGFFKELADYRFEKLHYLPQVVTFSAYQNQKLLEIGCGVGIDLIRFAQGGAIVTGVDLAETSIELAGQNFTQNGLQADLRVMNGEALTFEDNSFDVVYAHGVLQYTANPRQMIREMYRVLKPGGEAILMAYNKYSWLGVISGLTGVGLEHSDAPAFKLYSISELKDDLRQFNQVRLLTERFPVATRLHHGLKAQVYNRFFVGGFNMLPKAVVRPLGWHIMAFAIK
jgi:ubiquinone/menaquinone biosynthesis C-methylase UbiE